MEKNTYDIFIKQMQTELLEALKWFHSFCVSHGIRYSLHGGTLLGAVREKGFIPWDDDADVTLTRDEYNKLADALQNSKLPPTVLFFTYHRFPQLCFKREGHIAVWIDIFIYDAISENKILQKVKKGLLYFYMYLLIDPIKIGGENNASKIVKSVISQTINILGRIIPYGTKLKAAKKATQKLGGSGKLIHRANDAKAGMKIILPAYVMNEYLITKFEDTELMISKYYDEILTTSYGKDYMTPKQRGNENIQEAVIVYLQESIERLFSERTNHSNH